MRVIVNIDVPELAGAIDFYTRALPLTLQRMLDDDVAELVGASSVIYLLRQPQATQPVGTLPLLRDYARHWTPVHLDFVVADLEQARQRVLAAGAQQESARVDWRGSQCITFSDPFGHGFCLIAFRGATYEGEALQQAQPPGPPIAGPAG